MEQPFGSLDIRIKILYNIFKFSSAAPTFLETFLQLLETSEVEFFLSALPNFSGNFPQNCFEQVFCKANLRASVSVKKISTADAISDIFLSFKNAQGWNAQAFGMQLTKK